MLNVRGFLNIYLLSVPNYRDKPITIFNLIEILSRSIHYYTFHPIMMYYNYPKWTYPQACRNENDLKSMKVPKKHARIASFWKYYSGESVAPCLTIVIGGNHEASNHMWELWVEVLIILLFTICDRVFFSKNPIYRKHRFTAAFLPNSAIMEYYCIFKLTGTLLTLLLCWAS